MSYLLKLEEKEYNKSYDEAVNVYNNFVKNMVSDKLLVHSSKIRRRIQGN